MTHTVKLYSAPATEPISSTEAKLHLRVDVTDDDTLITALITAARQLVEEETWRALVTQTWDYVADDWPAGDAIRLPRPPIQSVTSITYLDDAGATQTMAAANYIVDTYQGRVVLAEGAEWPDGELYPASAVRVRYVAGYGAASTVPAPIKAAMLLLVGHLYENREAVASGAGVASAELPLGVRALLAPYRAWRWTP